MENQIIKNENLEESNKDISSNDNEISSKIEISIDDDQTEELICETLPPQKQRKILFIIIGIVAGIFIVAALAFFIPAQMKTSEISKALDLGEKCLEEGKYEEAILAYDNAIAIDNKITAPYVGKAEVYVATQDYEKAETVLLEAKNIAPDPQTNILLIEVYDSTKKTGEADKLLNETASIVEASIAKTKDKTKLVKLYDQLISVYQRLGKDSDTIKTICQDAFAKTGDSKYEELIKSLTIGNTQSNLSNRGYAVYSDGASYFSADNCIYKKIGNDTSLIFKDTIDTVQSDLNIVDGWLYYCSTPSAGTESSFNKMEIDGSNNTVIMSSKVNNNYHYSIANNRIYYYSHHIGTKNGAVYSMNLDGTDTKTVIENCCIYTIDNGWIYYRPGEYMNPTGLYRMKPDGSQQECLFEKIDDYATIWINNDSIYMLKKDLLYQASITDRNFTLLSNDQIDFININNGWIYYTAADSLTIKKMKCDGSEVTTLIAQTDEEIAAAYGPLSGNYLSESNRKTAYSLLNISGDNIYYLTLGFKGYAVCCVANLDGTNITKLGNR